MPENLENTTAPEKTQTVVEKRLQRELDEPIFSNHAVARCVEARERVFRDMMKQYAGDAAAVEEAGEQTELDGDYEDHEDSESETEDDIEEEEHEDLQARLEDVAKIGSIALKMADDAYRAALPPLGGEANIRNFVACIAHGMVLDVFEPNEGSKLLYAAQVAAFAESKRYRSRLVV